MATGVNPTTVEMAGPVMAKALGLRWYDNRTEVVEYLNKYRQLLYTLYPEYNLFDDVFHCVCLEDFTHGCVDGAVYRGFTLPEDVDGVEAVYKYGIPLTLHSRWRESHTGIGVGVGSLGRLGAVLMAEQFCTERDITTTSRIKIYTEHADDNGKRVIVEGLDHNGRKAKTCFTLVGDGVAVSRTRYSKILSVSLPSCRTGALQIMENGGRVLSIYTPCETVPVYRRMKVPAGCQDTTVLVHGNKRFRPIYFDHDIVEVGNSLIIEAAGHYFKYGETTTDQKELKRADRDLQTLATLLRGDIARRDGSAKQDGLPFHRPTRRRKTLTGYAR